MAFWIFKVTAQLLGLESHHYFSATSCKFSPGVPIVRLLAFCHSCLRIPLSWVIMNRKKTPLTATSLLTSNNLYFSEIWVISHGLWIVHSCGRQRGSSFLLSILALFMNFHSRNAVAAGTVMLPFSHGIAHTLFLTKNFPAKWKYSLQNWGSQIIEGENSSMWRPRNSAVRV